MYTGTAQNISLVIQGAISPVIPVIGYLVNRLENWALRWSQEKLAIRECNKTLDKLDRLKSKVKGSEKDKIDKLIDKVEKARKELKDSSSHTKIQLMEK